MRYATAFLISCSIVLASVPTLSWAQIAWVGDTSTDASDASNWGGGVAPGVGDNVLLRDGTSPNSVIDLGASDVEWANILFNEAADGTTVNGTGTLTANVPNGGTNFSIKGIESQSTDRVSTINPNVVTNGVIETRNTHDLVFNGAVTAYSAIAFQDSNITFNGDFTHNGYNFNGGEFMTGNFGNSSITFNAGLDLNLPAFTGDLGIRNGQTVAIGPDAVLTRTTPTETVSGLGVVNMFNQSTFRINGDNAIGPDTDLFSRDGGGTAQNTFDLNGFSATLEFIATPNASNFIIDFGEESGANTYTWAAGLWMQGTYNVINFEVGTDTLMLGESTGSTFWSAGDTSTVGGSPSDVEEKKSRITVNGVAYSEFDPGNTDPYWTIVDPTVSREIELFNFVAPGLAGDFNDDGVVDAADYTVWRANLGGDAMALNGNGSGAGTVVEADFLLWRSNYGSASGSAGAASSAVVPEPSSALLLFTLAGMLASVRRSTKC